MGVLEWQNVIFLIPLIFGCLLVVGSALGVVGHGHGFEPNVDADHDVSVGDHGIAHDVGHDVGADHGHDIGHDSHAVHAFDHGHDHEVDHGHGLFHRALGVLGIGRAPLSIVLMTICLLFGGTGIAANFILKPALVTGWLYGWISIAAAAFMVLGGTGPFAQLVARLMPATETSRVTSRDLIGRTGMALFEIVQGSSGYAQVYDRAGNLHQVRVRMRDAAVPKGGAVVLCEYLQDEDTFLVQSAPVV